MTKKSYPSLTRADAILFLSTAGALIAGEHPDKIRECVDGTVEALQTLGVSQRELREASIKGMNGDITRWDLMGIPRK